MTGTKPRLTQEAQSVFNELIEGNRRFREGKSKDYRYTPESIAEIAEKPAPIAAIVACSDSRVSPEIVFNQPLGHLFISRVPGNVASDSAKWMLELAVSVLQVPLVMVVGHTGCLAVKQVVDGQTAGSGGMLRMAVASAVLRARSHKPADVLRESIEENARFSVEQLIAESWAVQRAIEEGRTSIVAGVYEVETGEYKLV